MSASIKIFNNLRPAIDTRARSAAMYIARKKAARPLSEIARAFGLSHYGSASGMINRFAKQIQQDKTLEGMVIKAEKTIKVQT